MLQDSEVVNLQTVDNQIYFNKCPGVIAIYKS